MQSFKVLLHHRAASRPGGVLVGLFWTDPEEIDRSFPINVLRRIAATGAFGGWAIRRVLPMAQRVTSAMGSPAAFMLRWACELVVDRSVLVYAPPLCERIGPRLGPVRLFDDQAALWQSGRRRTRSTRSAGRGSPCPGLPPRGADLCAAVADDRLTWSRSPINFPKVANRLAPLFRPGSG